MHFAFIFQLDFTIYLHACAILDICILTFFARSVVHQVRSRDHISIGLFFPHIESEMGTFFFAGLKDQQKLLHWDISYMQ
jgi:hypothetical protein